MSTDREKLQRIKDWCDAYPQKNFGTVTDAELEEWAELIGQSNMTRLHGSWGRHILEGIKAIINA